MPRLSIGLLLLPLLAAAVPGTAGAGASRPNSADGGASVTAAAGTTSPPEASRLRREAARVEILRDTWGVPHIFGKTDADAVFGMVYAQAEDDFHRVEINYINGLGRLAEVEGESALWRDLRMKLFIDPRALKASYARSPLPMRRLMEAFADGLNWYLLTHPDVHPALITHFEPWMALSFSEGSIGGDIESVDLKALEAFYDVDPATHLGAAPAARTARVASSTADARPLLSPDLAGMPPEPQGSNGFAISPSRSASGHALLMINPHTSFYFRPEIHVVSEEGLNAYGAVTWGQFFVYQGFNAHLGWMHTSGGGDVIDEYLETVRKTPGGYAYRYGKGERPLRAVTLRLPYRSGSGMAERSITVYYSQHGPIIRSEDGKWVAVDMMNSPLPALTQSFTRTKARSYAEFHRALEIRTNSSNNTVYADDAGNTALFYGNFVPVRDPAFDWTKPVDGSDPRTEWHGLHALKDLIQVHNPVTGWIQNTNNAPFNAAGSASPHKADYPRYMWSQPENPRGIHAARVLERNPSFTIDSLIAAAYDPELTAFERAIPALLEAWDAQPDGDALKLSVAAPIAALRSWDHRCGVSSVPTSLAIYWAQDLAARTPKAEREYDEAVVDSLVRLNPPKELLLALQRASTKLEADFGTWQTPWGDINRFQRLSGAIDLSYDDSKPSLPIGFASGIYGSLAAFGNSAGHGNTRRTYGDVGNSFVAAVEFGPRLRAKSLLAGGESGDPESPHFVDQAQRYARGDFKDVWFYREDIEQHLERRYHPGE